MFPRAQLSCRTWSFKTKRDGLSPSCTPPSSSTPRGRAGYPVRINHQDERQRNNNELQTSRATVEECWDDYKVVGSQKVVSELRHLQDVQRNMLLAVAACLCVTVYTEPLEASLWRTRRSESETQRTLHSVAHNYSSCCSSCAKAQKLLEHLDAELNIPKPKRGTLWEMIILAVLPLHSPVGTACHGPWARRLFSSSFLLTNLDYNSPQKLRKQLGSDNGA